MKYNYLDRQKRNENFVKVVPAYGLLEDMLLVISNRKFPKDARYTVDYYNGFSIQTTRDETDEEYKVRIRQDEINQKLYAEQVKRNEERQKKLREAREEKKKKEVLAYLKKHPDLVSALPKEAKKPRKPATKPD